MQEKQRKPFKRLSSKNGLHTALKRGVNGRPTAALGVFTEWSRREPSDIDGQPEG